MLYSFTGGDDGADPATPVALDAEGNLYGTTSNYGAGGAGVLYEVPVTGGLNVLHSFGKGPQGYSGSTVVVNSAGHLYGTTPYGGNDGCYMNLGCGVFYEYDAAHGYTVLFTFPGGAGGQGGALTLSPAGVIYGAGLGGVDGGGLIYKMTIN